MNDQNKSRRLSIEPLEIRSLLAGNPLAGANTVIVLVQEIPAPPPPQAYVQAMRAHEVRMPVSDNGRFIRQTIHLIPGGAAGEMFRLTDDAPANLNSQPAIAPTPTEDQPAVQASTVNTSSRSAIAAVDTSISSLTSRELSAVELDVVRSPTAEYVLVSPEPISVTETAKVQRQATSLEADSLQTADEPPEQWIDLSPSRLRISFDDALESPHEPWQIDEGALASLGKVIERASNHRAAINDAAIAEQLGRPEGMIAIDQVSLPANSFSAELAWFDVQLESTVNLHRSLEMIANDTTPPISDVALDAIMVTLGQIADSQAQPIKSTDRFEVPEPTYPAVAIVTAAAIAARRKRRHPQPRTLPSADDSGQINQPAATSGHCSTDS